jgi:ubiquinone/menaquinone biosynthesis C-methylase UbiE
MSIEAAVGRYYAQDRLLQTVLDAFAALGKAPDAITIEDLRAIDEFHMGGHQATATLGERMELSRGASLLDIGCGLGGAARFFAKHFGCAVAAIDLTSDYVAVAAALTKMVGLDASVRFAAASATALPFAAGAFDAATVLHAGMNIPDKVRLFAEAARVLNPRGVLGIYDVMRTGDAGPDYPVAWAADAATSFLSAPAEYRQALKAAGFFVEDERSQRELALAVFGRLRALVAKHGPSPVGLHLVMGANAGRKVANMIAALEAHRIAPIEMICRRR